MNKAILCDIHHTIIDEDNKPIPKMVELLNNLSKFYAIIIITGRNLTGREDRHAQLEQLSNAGLSYDRFIFNDNTYDIDGLNPNKNKDEPKLKAKMLREFLHKYPDFNIEFAFDNNSKCDKQYRKMGINTFKPKFS